MVREVSQVCQAGWVDKAGRLDHHSNQVGQVREARSGWSGQVRLIITSEWAVGRPGWIDRSVFQFGQFTVRSNRSV